MKFLRSRNVNSLKVAAPIAGRCVSLTKVHDEVFAHKMMGEGFAIQPLETENIIVAPVTGKVVALPTSKHAVGIKVARFNLEILIHIGLNTVSLKGQGFQALAKVNSYVKQGMPLIQFDNELMKQKQLDMTTMVIFTEGYAHPINLGKLADSAVKSGQVLLQAE
ncbi:PTS glucose transporter subunit IIA [Bombilactobacillus folatiphilus]|uniref:PTS glucose transporter subunit IIA n=1 Tax=Bombilactobacillus folatiphilus TaxID=2923362 RepID=A0ABY4PAZ3_9LACO|nr:PTS glucose transporter subunit IIA [Bombilactobacillus folatiphilus]UQS82814.1 PTS glucose transporter subunit IIA [Bombilactobacillus folatiphilus]